MFRSIFSSIYFNFHYLPFKQAIKLPIILYKPYLLNCKGKVIIDGNIKTAMIQLGRYNVSLYPNSGIVFENNGGEIIFQGECSIGNNSAISIGTKGHIKFGNKFAASSSLKLVSYSSIEFDEYVRIGWDCLITDTDFHKMKKMKGGYSKGYGPIKIGKRNWIGSKCCILKNTETPNFCTISAGNILNKQYQVPEYSILCNDSNIIVKVSGLYRELENDKILYK